MCKYVHMEIFINMYFFSYKLKGRDGIGSQPPPKDCPHNYHVVLIEVRHFYPLI